MQHPLTWLFERPYPTEPKYVKRLKEELQIIKVKTLKKLTDKFIQSYRL